MIAGDTGFFLNDEMDDFTIKPGAANLFGLVQGKNERDRTRQAAVKFDESDHRRQGRQTFMVLGSPGGSRIITIVVAGDPQCRSTTA